VGLRLHLHFIAGGYVIVTIVTFLRVSFISDVNKSKFSRL